MSVIWFKRTSGRGSRSLNQFLERFVNNVATCTQKYHNAFIHEIGYSDYNLFSNERGTYSLMSAAIHGITPIHQSEVRVLRKRDRRVRNSKGKKKFGTGRVDLWCYKDGVEYFFEFKRSYAGLNWISGGKKHKTINELRSTLRRQIGEVKSGILEESDYQECEKSIHFIGLQIITPYRTGEKCKLRALQQVTRKDVKRWINTLSPAPDAILCHFMNDDMRINPIKWDVDGNKEINWTFHPLHLFCFTILDGQKD